MKKLLHKSLQLFLWFAILGFVAPISVVAADCYIAGSFNGWNATATKLTQNGSQYELFKTFDAGTQFKIVYNDNWYGYDAVKNGKDLVSSADGDNKNIQFNATGCYGLFFKNNGELYITKRDDCPQAYSLWGFDILYQEGDTKKWASTKGSANRWDGNFIKTSGDNETYDLGVVKKGTKFIGFRVYTNDNGADVGGMKVIWSDVDSSQPAIQGGDYGLWNNSGTQAGQSGGTDEVWDQTDRSNQFMGYSNGTYAFNLVFELKVNGQDKQLVRTIKVTYTIDEFELVANISGALSLGSEVPLSVTGGTAPYTWQESTDGVTWTTISGVTGANYNHTMKGEVSIRVQSGSKTTNVVTLKPSIMCDKFHTDTIFVETFGTLSEVTARAAYNVSTSKYSAYVPSGYTAHTGACKAMKSEGLYAVVANPMYAGCGEESDNITDETKDCDCINKRRWYRGTEDHTENDVNGGMLFYNCKDGSQTDDVIYECVINDICANTYINFSAWVTNANTGAYGNIPIEAEFRLFDYNNTTKPLASYEVTNINLKGEWKEISAMFNSQSATKVKIQLVNKAAQGQGNDLLLDDIMLRVCRPNADLFCSNGKTEIDIASGNTETLTASLVNGIMDNPFYLWQYQTTEGWKSIGDPELNKDVLVVTPQYNPTYYRVIIANTAEEAIAVSKETTSSACGMSATTNVATVNVAFPAITITKHPKDDIVCEGEMVAFTAEATVADTYQWQKSSDKINWVDIPGATKLEYNIENSVYTDPNETYYRVVASASNGTTDPVPSNAAKLTVHQLPELKSISVDDNAICANGSTNINYTIAGGVGQYTLTMQREMNDATQTFDIANLGTKDVSGVASSFSVIPTSTATFSFTQVKDAYCTNTVDENLSVTVNVKSINIVTDVKDTTICSDTKATLKVKATGDDLQYKWYESTDGGNNYTAVGENQATYTTNPLIKADDKDYRYKVTVSQSSGVCKPIDRGPAKVTVNDCSEFSMQYVPTKNEICQDATIDLAFSLKNTSTTMAQTGVEVTITGLANQTLTLPSAATRVGDNIIWKVGDLQPGTKQEITITLKGTKAETINSKAYVSKSGSNTYTEADQKALVPHTITVKAISQKPIVKLYAACPTPGSINLVEEYISLIDKDGNPIGDKSGVQFYELKNAVYTKTTGFVNTDSVANQTGNEVTTLYVSNKNAGECESPKVPITATVYPPVKATISGDATICNTDGAYLAINIPSGKPNFTLKYKVETDKEGPIEKELTDLADREFSIPVYPTEKTVYTLTYVEDANKCKADLRKSGSATVVVNNKPSFTLVETTLGDLCAGTALELPAITADNGGTAITEQGWYLAGQAITSIGELSIESHNGKKLTYKATNECGTEEKTYTTLSVKDCADFKLTYLLSNANPCAGDAITLTATITNDGDADLSDVKLWQTWSGNQGVVANVKQFDYDMGDYQNGKWEIATFPSKATATLTITFIAQADEDFYMHVTESNGIPYDSWTNSPAKDKQTLTVKPISGNVELNDLVGANATYKVCALDATSTQTLSLSSLVGSDKFSLQYYEEDATGVMKQEPLTAEPVIKLNEAFGPKNYYIINTEYGMCPSEIPTKVTVQVLAKPSISLTKTEVTLNCSDQTPIVTVSGASTYKWTDATGAETTGDKLNLSRENVASRTYTVVGYSADNCASDALTLTVTEDFATPDVSITLPTLGAADEPYIDNKTLTCNLASIVLTASSSKTVTYTWNDALATQGSTLTVTDKGEYQVTAVSADNGCSSTAVQSIGINKTKPTLSVATTDNSTIINCIRTAIIMDPSVSNADALGGDVSYAWYKDDALFAETEATEAGLYKVVAVGRNGCPNEVSLNITADTDTLAMDLTATVATITCAHPVSVLKTTLTDLKEVSLLWNNGKTSDTIQVREGGVYSVIATASNGCESKAEVELDQKTDLPKVEITPTDAIQLCRVNTLTASGATTYVWNTGSEAESIDVSEAGTYTVTGTNEYGCKKDTTLVLEDGKVIPVVKVESNHASITCTNPQVTFTATVTNANADHSYAYQWTISNESTVKGTKNTLSVADGKTYKVVVTDNDNFCKGEKTYSVSVKKDQPLVVQNAAWAAVCLPATINLEDAIDTEKTIADEVLFFEDELLTQPVTNTQIDMETYKVYYAQGMEVNGNGCKGVATPIAVNLKPATSAPLVKDYDECPEVGSKPLNQMLTSPYYKLTFYSQATGGAPIADAFDASKANTTTTYYVTNTNQGACESERVAFEVAIAGLVDIELDASETSMMVGGDPVVITVTSAGVDPDTYRWMVNGKELQVEGNEYEANLYIDTKFEVAASGRCNSVSKEVEVEVLWPTAFTPYNNNGLNETFAKGLPVSIFNRFGIQVYEGADGWDGVMNKNMGANEMALPGVYYYAVPLPDGNVKKGTIEIVKF